jgi:hypothetical protein
MQPKPIKKLDQFRPNVLPRLSSTRPQKFSSTVPNELNDPLQKEKLLELLSQTERIGLANRPDVMKLMEKERLQESAYRKHREKDMFVLDATDIFSLPGKPEQTGLLSPEHRRIGKGATRKLKVIDSTSESSTEEKETAEKLGVGEFAFLNESLGRTKSEFLADSDNMESPTGHPSLPSSPTNTGQQKQPASGSNNTSDLDQIAGILEGIVTGGDALYFFARFGSETPVKFVHLVQVEDCKIYRYLFFLILLAKNLYLSATHLSISLFIPIKAYSTVCWPM